MNKKIAIDLARKYLKQAEQVLLKVIDEEDGELDDAQCDISCLLGELHDVRRSYVEAGQ